MSYDDYKLSTPDNDTVECPDCEGTGHSEGSYCCDATLDEDTMLCSKCNDHSNYEDCETCKGKGTIKKYEL